MPEPLRVSVIMPVYNHAGYVGAAIESVLAQTHAEWELLVIDDGSTDHSGQIAAAYAARDARIRAIPQANAGPSAARNRGIREARYPFLAFLDSDDLYYPEALSTYAAVFSANPQARFVHGYRHRLLDNGMIERSAGEHQDRPTGARELFARMYLSHLCVCYRRELAEATGGYDIALPTAEDYDLYLRMTLLADVNSFSLFCPINHPTGLRRRHTENISRPCGQLRFLEALMLERFASTRAARAVLPPRLVRRRLARVYYTAGRAYVAEKRPVHAMEALRRSYAYCNTPRALALLAATATLRPLLRGDSQPLPALRPL